MGNLNNISQTVISMIKKIIDIKIPIDENTNLHSLGLDSIRICELIFEIEEKYNIYIQSEALSSFKIVKDLADYIKEHVS